MRSVRFPLKVRRRALLSLTGALAVVAAGVAACAPAALLDVFVPSDGYAVREGIAYGPEARQALDVYVPEPASTAGGGPRPVVVFFYGGSWTDGERRTYRFVGEAFARLGYVVVVPDYRLYPEVRFPAFVRDAAGAVRWVTDAIGAHGGDPKRIVLTGHSAGAHIAALLALDPRYLDDAGVPRSSVRGLVGLAGPYAFDPFAYASTRPVFDGADPAAVRPVAFAGAGVAPPALLLHGADDGTVSPRNSRELAAALDGVAPATVREYDGLGHIGIVLSLAAPFRGRDGVYGDIERFLATSAAGP